MPTLFPNGIDLSTEHLVRVASEYNVVQEPGETVPEAIIRLEDKIIQRLVEPVKRRHRLELADAQQLTETYLTKL
ncbi:MAG: hypothetical protein ACYTBJ_26940 [Planctomycetota bacterium]|jgi:hypothetical protein